MVRKTFCDVCGKEIVEEGTKEESAFIGELTLSEFTSLDDFQRESVWSIHALHLCPGDLKKVKEMFHLE